MPNHPRPTVVITTPLEREHAERIIQAFPKRIELRYRPDLLSPIRFPGDHGDSAWHRTLAQDQEWREILATRP
ncbi:MAG TPA: hypothetical protein VGR16_07510 [Thermomicrobiales bacterium]|nr:hypothetical protein [Thermomicrobiales bacterium]